jgi:hypothetical protein
MIKCGKRLTFGIDLGGAQVLCAMKEVGLWGGAKCMALLLPFKISTTKRYLC